MMTKGSPFASTLLALAAVLGGCSERPASVTLETREGAGPSMAGPASSTSTPSETTPMPMESSPESGEEIVTFGAGCFWCIEAVLEQVDGILGVQSGYMGGSMADPTYKDVCTGQTGHAEVVQVRFDPATISFEELMEWFWHLHDPTTLNRQGNDVGTQYRSAVFYHSERQREIAEKSKAAKEASGEFSDPIVTEITPASTFYPAEDYHQDYYRQNKTQGYCRYVIAPKLDKLGLEK